MNFRLKSRLNFNFFKPLEIFTDGSHKGRWGSWAFILVRGKKVIFEASGRERKTNSHRMEFQAAIEALKYLPKGTKALLHTDSRVLLETVSGENKRAPVNADQVKELLELTMKHKISWCWVKAHAGQIYNERCDQLCVQARKL